MDKMEEESKGKAHQEDEALKSDSRIQWIKYKATSFIFLWNTRTF